MPNSLSDVLNRPIPEKLWHYTSVQGFQGIVTSREIFATDVRFLNDRTEFIHAREIAEQVIAETNEYGANSFPAKDYSKKAVDLAFDAGPLSADQLQVFVASFSEAEDQLSQWRGYSQGSSGISIAFDLKALRPPAHVGTLVTFAPCIYKIEHKKAILQDALSHFVGESQGYWNSAFEAAKASWFANDPTGGQAIIDNIMGSANFKTDIGVALVKTRADLLRVAALSKHESFYEEKEWRLVLPISTEKTALKNPPRFRAANTTLIPYIAYPLSPDPATAVPLTDVILGPGSHINAGHAALAFLKSRGISVERVNQKFLTDLGRDSQTASALATK
jgi:hypothetical protein